MTIIEEYTGRYIRERIERCRLAGEEIFKIEGLEYMREAFSYLFEEYIQERKKSLFLDILSKYSRIGSLIINNVVDGYVKNMENFEFSKPPDPRSMDYLPLLIQKGKCSELICCIMEQHKFHYFGYCLLIELKNLNRDLFYKIDVFIKQLEDPVPGMEETLSECLVILKQIEYKI